MLEKINKSFQWRGVNQLLATFLCILVIGGACKKKENPLGVSALPEGSALSTQGIDTFSLITYSELEDSTVSKNPRFNLLGSYIDPVFGAYNASFYTQFRPSTLSPNFEDNIKIDSFVLALEYGGYYGELDPQLIEVYEITEDLDADEEVDYYTFSTSTTANLNLVPTANNEGLITPNPLAPTIVDGEEVADAQLRLHLDTNLARTFINSALNTSNFETEENFLTYFKGIHVKTNNGLQVPGKGGVLYFNTADPASGLTIYYTVNGIQQSFEFIINATDVDYNNVTINPAGTEIEDVLNNPETAGLDEFYTQAGHIRSKIDLPGIKNLPKNAIIHSAELILPVSYYNQSTFYPSTFISLSSRLIKDDNRLYSLPTSEVQYDTGRKAYVIDLRTYVQNVVAGSFEDNGILLSPSFFNTSAERIIFNGSQTINKDKPILTIDFTTF